MEEIRKQTVSRIAEFFNGESTNAEVDTYKKLLDFEKEVKQQFSLQGVSHQRELLDAFCCTMEFDVKHETYEEDINYFLENVKADNCG